jgi:hypothetical protein
MSRLRFGGDITRGSKDDITTDIESYEAGKAKEK